MNKLKVTNLGEISYKIESNTKMQVIPKNFIMRNYIESSVSICGIFAIFKTETNALQVNLDTGEETVWDI